MTWATQVRHVFVRNAADSWVTLAVVGAVTGLITAAAVTGHVLGLWSAMLIDYAMRGALLYHIASVVVSDPPPHPGSFWATQPRRPSAVATAKLLHVVVVLLLLAAAALLTLTAWHFDADTFWKALHTHLRYAAITVIPVVTLASLFPNRPRAALGAAMLGVVYGNLFEQEGRSSARLIAPVGDAVSHLPPWAWVPAIAIPVGMLLWRYHRAEVLAAAEYPLIMLVLLPYALLVQHEPEGTAPATVVDTPKLSLVVEPSGDYIAVGLHAPQGLPGDAYKLIDWSMVATRRDGSTIRLRGFDTVLRDYDEHTAVVRTPGDAVRVFGAEVLDVHDSTTLHTIAGSFLGHSDVTDVVSARLEGILQSFRMVEVDRFPLRDGRARSQDGRRAEIRTFPADTAGPTIALRTTWLGGTTGERAAWAVPADMQALDLAFALVNPSRQELLPLRVDDSHFPGMGARLFGLGVMGYDYTLRPALWTPSAPSIDSTWLADAEFVVGSPVRTGAVRISLNGVVSPVTARR